MLNKNERIGIKLNSVTVTAFAEYKKLFLGSDEIPISDGYIISSAFNYIEDDVNNIDWEKVNSAFIPNVTDNIKDEPFRTTVTIESKAYDGLKKLQLDIKNEIGSRIFFSHVIKLVLFATILKKNNKLDEYLKY